MRQRSHRDRAIDAILDARCNLTRATLDNIVIPQMVKELEEARFKISRAMRSLEFHINEQGQETLPV